MEKRFLFLAGLIVVLGLAVPARADDLGGTDDPPVLTITTPGCGAPCRVFDRKVNDGINILGTNSVRITDTGTSGLTNPNVPPLPPLTGPVLLIIGIPNVSSTMGLPFVTLSKGTGAAGGPNVYPTNTTKWDKNGFVGFFTGAFTPPKGSPNTVESFIGLTTPGGSGSTFARWQTVDADLAGITANGFGIFVFELNGTGLASNKWVDLFFSGRIPRGSFVLAYGCSGTLAKRAGACPGKNTFTTQFQQGGLVVPEPASLILLGSGLLVTGALRRRQQKQHQAAASAVA